jgi:hypothetical protein
MEKKVEVGSKRRIIVILEGVDRYRVVEAMVEGVRVILNYRGETYSPAYVHGIAGTAFHVAGICPCAPTCTPGVDPLKLAQAFGYLAEQMPLFNESINWDWDKPAPDEMLYSMIDRIKEDIRRERPVLVWHVFMNCEWDVVAGFNDEKKVFLGRGSNQGLDEYAEASWTRPRESLDICPALGAIFIGEKIGNFDVKGAELASLKAAVAHAHSQLNVDKLGCSKWVFLEGYQAYQRWVNDFRNPEKVRDLGDAYCYGIYRSTHRTAADYLEEIAPKHLEIRGSLLAASNNFKAEADILDQAESLLWWNSPEGPDPERNRKAFAILEQAYEHYQRGIEAIEELLEKVT